MPYGISFNILKQAWNDIDTATTDCEMLGP